MITTAIFQKNPVTSSPLRGGGKKFTITSETTNIDGNTHRWFMIWVVPVIDGVLNYDTATIQIYMSTQTYYEYDTEGVTQLKNLPQGLKDRIVSDFNTLTQVTEKPVHEDDREEDSSTIVRTETVYGTTITMTREVIIGNVRYSINSTLGGASQRTYISQEDAEEGFEHQVMMASLSTDNGTIVEYRGVTIDFDNLQMGDNSQARGTVKSVALIGGDWDRIEFVEGQEIVYNDGMGIRSFGTITFDETSDLIILKEYIDARLGVRVEQDAEVVGLLDVYSWGWYNKQFEGGDARFNPFSKIIMNEVFTLSNTDGRILALKDSDTLADSGNLLLRIKEGYRVRIKLMTQELNYFEENIPSLESLVSNSKFSGESTITYSGTGRYDETDQIVFDMVGGDTIQIDIDSEYSETTNFSITTNGQQIVRASPPTIDNETYIAIIEVEKFSKESGGGIASDSNGSNLGGGSQGSSDTNGDDTDTSMGVGNGIAIVVVSILIIGILWMVLRDGE